MIIKNIVNSYLNQHVIGFHSGAIGGLARGGNDVVKYRQSNTASPPSEKALKVLIAVPSHALSNPGMKDVSHAYLAFTKAGYKADFVTADGSPVQFGHSDLTDSVNRWFVEDTNAKYGTDQPLEVKDVMPNRYVGVYFAGSNGLVIDSHWFKSLAEQILNNNGVVAGSGDAETAVQNLELTNYLESGYSLPKSDSGRPLTDYGSAAAEAVRLEAGWMIYKNELIMSEEGEPELIGERIVQQLKK